MPLITNEEEHRAAFDVRVFTIRQMIRALIRRVRHDSTLAAKCAEYGDYLEELEATKFDLDRFETEHHYTPPSQQGLVRKEHLRQEIARMSRRVSDLQLQSPDWEKFHLSISAASK